MPDKTGKGTTGFQRLPKVKTLENPRITKEEDKVMPATATICVIILTSVITAY